MRKPASSSADVLKVVRQALSIGIAALVAVPLWGSPAVIGTVTNSQSASVRGISLVEGTNIYDGDIVQTSEKGDAWLALSGGAGILLGQDTQVQLSEDRISTPNTPDAPIDFDVSQGTVKFRSTAQTMVEGLLYDATIRPANSPEASGYVYFTSPTSAIIGSEKGDLLVTTEHDGATRLIPSGSAIAVDMIPSEQNQDQNPNQNRSARRRKGLIVIFAAASIGAITIVAIILNHHERHHVSPSSFPGP
ncbi:MAG TPA: hypothetical protein VGR81_14010 [Candidatus Acidoferrales bacterium]|nr:hypothetical protein [Candidatus Acidoferrales bacterium]